MTKLTNFPPVYYISLEESTDRRENLHRQFEEYGVANLRGIISKKYKDSEDRISEKYSGNYINTLSDASKGVLVSNIKVLIDYIRYNSEEPYIFVCEDDLSLETVKYWDFTWNDFINSIHVEWDIIQLLVVRDDFENRFEFRKREWNDWAATAYLIKKEYAQKLVQCHYDIFLNEYFFDISEVQPIIENVLYGQTERAYSIPLFVEEVNKFDTTLKVIHHDNMKDGFEMINGQGKSHITSYHDVINWWKNKSQQSLIERYALDTESPYLNYDLALWYHNQGQTASAISYYLRAADRSVHTNAILAYECLLHMADCFSKQKNRDYTVRSLYKRAISLLPERPEAYFLLSRFDEWTGNYIDSYTISSLALTICDENISPLNNVEYPGIYGIIFEKAISSYWLGKNQECRDTLLKLKNNYDLAEPYKTLVGNNLMQLGCFTPVSLKYEKSRYDNFKFHFPGLENIEKSEGQALQDMFVLSVINGKRNGTYLEIGAQEPRFQNNTYILEKNFDWKGISIEIRSDLCEMFQKERSNKILCEDATTSNYEHILSDSVYNNSKVIDYLQIDCEPSKTTFEILLSIPFDIYKFNIITYEHDHFVDMTNTYRKKSRNYLKSLGYILLVSDVSQNENTPFEDWWIHPNIATANLVNKFKSTDKNINDVREYFYHNFNY